MHPFARPFVAYFRWCEARHPHISKSMAMRVYLLLATTLITSVLMWTYAWVSFFYVDDSLLKVLGFVYAALHLSGPLIFRQTGSLTFATYIMLLSGGIFQVHFSWLTGGFYTTTVIWVGILPLIAGLMTNIRHTIIWSIFALGSIVLLMSLELAHHPFPQLMRKEGLFLTHLCVLIGMIALNSGFTIFLILLDKSQVGNQANKTLEKQNLVRVLAHDIANPLSIIANCNSILMKGILDPERQLKMQSMIDRSSQQIADILNTVRQLEACESASAAILRITRSTSRFTIKGPVFPNPCKSSSSVRQLPPPNRGVQANLERALVCQLPLSLLNFFQGVWLLKVPVLPMERKTLAQPFPWFYRWLQLQPRLRRSRLDWILPFVILCHHP